jgi:hypothetical protein
VKFPAAGRERRQDMPKTKLTKEEKESLAAIIAELNDILARAEKGEEVEVPPKGALRTKVTSDEGRTPDLIGIVGRIC